MGRLADLLACTMRLIIILSSSMRRLSPCALEVHVLLADSEHRRLPRLPPLRLQVSSKTSITSQNLIEPSRCYKSVRLSCQPVLSSEIPPPYSYGFPRPNVRCSRQCLLSSPFHRCSYIWVSLWFPEGSRSQSWRVASSRGMISPKSS